MIRHGLTRIGAHTPERWVHWLNAAVNYIEVGCWLRTRGFPVPRRFRTREELYEAVARDIADQHVLYLEFGVFEGQATRYWSRLLRHPQSALHGFDSFEGLQTRWNIDTPAGSFSTNGRVPQIDDPRVRWFKGWFEDTLPTYAAPVHDRLIVNLDADLYAPTAFVLAHLELMITPGAILIFDEFSDRANELRAFEEFLDRSGKRFRLLGATRAVTHVAFECLGGMRRRASPTAAGS